MSRPCGCSPDIRALWFALLAAVVAVLMSVYGIVTLINEREVLLQRMRDQAAGVRAELRMSTLARPPVVAFPR